MPKRKRGLTTEEIQKVLADLEDEIFDDSLSDCELENEEDDLDQSLNLNPEVEDEVVSEKQIRKITEETNIYATRVLQSATPSSLRKHNPGWTETSEEEILKFLSLILLMGHVDKDNIKEYWSTDPMLETPFFKKIMPRDRFLNLLRYLHFENNDHAPDKTASDYDRLWKLRNVFNSLNNSFQEIYDPTEELAIDEVIVVFKGRIIFKQYILKKRKRFGIKVYKIVDKKGYTFNMKVYLGADRERLKSGIKVKPTHATVLELAESIKNKGHKLFMDNFFSSPELFQ
ncbi:piggyBac transposable element-derived protein 4 [Trichonephila clavipes]|uniref:PiggyBac transposable element-derived protein 4 n=1 Tax=Trichonephila clavipes TaxID=2585209 RepID=A0A8X7B7L8_TRICX|nr:piggyBac transposable element-derived protein 4 [Trichonephila clavipes]